MVAAVDVSDRIWAPCRGSHRRSSLRPLSPRSCSLSRPEIKHSWDLTPQLESRPGPPWPPTPRPGEGKKAGGLPLTLPEPVRIRDALAAQRRQSWPSSTGRLPGLPSVPRGQGCALRASAPAPPPPGPEPARASGCIPDQTSPARFTAGDLWPPSAASIRPYSR